MDEARRFTRYIMPGAVFVLLTVLYLWIIIPDWLEPTVGALAENDGVGAAVAGLLASGALGAIFSVIHHALHWCGISSIDHSDVVNGLVKTENIVVWPFPRLGQAEELQRPPIDMEMAASLLVGLWYERIDSAPIKGADPKVTSLSDTAHSLGAARVAAAAAIPAALAIVCHVSVRSSEPWAEFRFVVALSLAACVSVVFWRAHARVARVTRTVIDQVILQAILGKAPAVTTSPAKHETAPVAKSQQVSGDRVAATEGGRAESSVSTARSVAVEEPNSQPKKLSVWTTARPRALASGEGRLRLASRYFLAATRTLLFGRH